jgi:hypothetical protein
MRQWPEVQKVLRIRQLDTALNFPMVTPHHADIGFSRACFWSVLANRPDDTETTSDFL